MKKRHYLFLLTFLLLLIAATPLSAATKDTTAPFRDVPQKEWYAEYVYDLVELGLLQGYENNTFRPQNSITRAEITTILANLSGENIAVYKNITQFRDCIGHWAAASINWAADKGIVNGIGDGKFDPDAPITREAFCTMILRHAKYEGHYPQKTVKAIDFRDADTISSWARASVYHMQQAGIINGIGNDCFAPLDDTTRAQAAAIFHRYLNCNDDKTAKAQIEKYKVCFRLHDNNSNYFLADFTHDGYDDMIVIQPSAYGAYIYVYTITNSSLNMVYNSEVYPTAVRDCFYLYENAKGAYLLHYIHDSATGQTIQQVDLFYGSKKGGIAYDYSNSINFYIDGSPLDTGYPAAYFKDQSYFQNLESHSVFLFGSIENEMAYTDQCFPDAIGNWGSGY